LQSSGTWGCEALTLSNEESILIMFLHSKENWKCDNYTSENESILTDNKGALNSSISGTNE
jgi:hypothetical protein